MEKSNITFISIKLLIILLTYIIFRDYFIVLLIFTGAFFLLSIINSIIYRNSNGDVTLFNYRLVKYIKHKPNTNKYYFITIEDNSCIFIYKSTWLYSRYINSYYYDSSLNLDLNDLKKHLLYCIDIDNTKKTKDNNREIIKKWSGALTDELERDNTITKILK